ncbi:unnamed protein product [Calypogeia fissa]
MTHNHRDGVRASLSWRDLSVVVNNRKTVLHGLSGVAEPGRLVAVMGPSGSGKSTLLDALAGRLSKDATVTGEIMLNGLKAQLSYGTAAYLAQDVPLLGTLTVYEAVYYSAMLRFPTSMSRTSVKSIVEATITEVGLKRSMHTLIGNWQRRGISGGEKRRVSIAVELLTSPRLLFLDEPTSGLDSASAYNVVSTLKKLARDERTIMTSIHQPSSEVFSLFDDICLLSSGKQVYFGPLHSAVQFFSLAGFPCAPLRNPSDHYLLCINSDFDDVYNVFDEYADTDDDLENSRPFVQRMTAAEAVRTLTQAFAASKEKLDVEYTIQVMEKLDGSSLDSKGSQAGFIKQTYVLTKRSFVNMSRDLGYYWLRLLMYIILSIAIGTIYYKVGYGYTAIQARGGCMSFIVAFLTFMAVGGFPSFVEDMKVFGMERLNGHYGVAAYVFGNTFSSIPFLFLISLVSSAIAYLLVDLHHGYGHFLYFVVSLFACLLVAESMMMAIASLVPNFLMGIIVGAGIQGMFILVAGFYRLLNDLPKPVWRYPMSYIAFHPYAFQGMLENDFKGLTFRNQNPGGADLKGEYILRDVFDVTTSISKWENLIVLFGMAIGYRCIFYVLIRASETVIPAGRSYVARKLLLQRSPSKIESHEASPLPDTPPV